MSTTPATLRTVVPAYVARVGAECRGWNCPCGRLSGETMTLGRKAVMPQGSSASPGWFVKVINEVTKGLEQVAAYLDDVIVFDSDPWTHVKTIRALLERLRKHNLKLSPSKARLGATDADFLGHSISPAGVRPNADKVSALTLMPMPRDLKQLRSLLGGLSYYRKILLDMSKRIRPITALLKKGVKFLFTPSMEVIVRDMLAELAAPPVLVFSVWDAVADGSRLFGCTATPALTALALR